MNALEVKRTLDARQTSSAITSAKTLKWRESVAFDPSLAVSLDPVQVYEFNSRVWADPNFSLELQQDPDTLLNKYGLAKIITCPLDPATLAEHRLTEEELATVREVVRTAAQNGLVSQELLEKELSGEGYGVPAIAALVLVVAVAVAVWVVVVAAA